MVVCSFKWSPNTHSSMGPANSIKSTESTKCSALPQLSYSTSSRARPHTWNPTTGTSLKKRESDSKNSCQTLILPRNSSHFCINCLNMTQPKESPLNKLFSMNTSFNLQANRQPVNSVRQFLAFQLRFHKINRKKMKTLRRNTRSRKIRERKRFWRSKIQRRSLKSRQTHCLPSINWDWTWNSICMDRRLKPTIIFSRRPWRT